MNHEPRIREMERASVNRWFPTSPLGPMFDAGKGRMLPMPADAGDPWREEAYARIDKYLVEAHPPSQDAMVAVILVFTSILLALQPLLGFNGAQIGGIVMGGVGVWHGQDVYLLYCYRRDLRDLRARIAASLALRSPLPAELGARYRQTNPWRTALQVWVFSLVALAILAQHFVSPDQMTGTAMAIALLAVAIAWLLYFASRRVDRSQQR